MNHPEDFANSLVLFDDMGENIILPSADELYSSGRQNNINIICVGHTVTDLTTKTNDNTPLIFITLISSLKGYLLIIL